MKSGKRYFCPVQELHTLFRTVPITKESFLDRYNECLAAEQDRSNTSHYSLRLLIWGCRQCSVDNSSGYRRPWEHLSVCSAWNKTEPRAHSLSEWGLVNQMDGLLTILFWKEICAFVGLLVRLACYMFVQLNLAFITFRGFSKPYFLFIFSYKLDEPNTFLLKYNLLQSKYTSLTTTHCHIISQSIMILSFTNLKVYKTCYIFEMDITWML